LARWSMRGRDELIYVVDQSMRRHLPESERKAWRRMTEPMVVVPHADHELLRIASTRGLGVISNDTFRDYRRAHPWLEQRPPRVISWGVVDGAIALTVGTLPRVPDAVVSEREEHRALNARHIDPHRDRALLLCDWRCVHAGCLQHDLFPTRLLVWPEVSAGTAICPGCRRPLERLGPRVVVRQLVVTESPTGAERLRIPLDRAQRLKLGRGSLPDVVDITGGMDPDRALRISREHLLVSLGGRGRAMTLVVRDLGSRNGSEIRRWLGSNFAKPDPLPTGEDVLLGRGDLVELAGCLTVRLSGQHFGPPPDLPVADETGDDRFTA